MSDAPSEARKAGSLPARYWRPIADLLSLVSTIFAICWSLELPRYVGWAIYPEQYFAAILACFTALVFLSYSSSRRALREEGQGAPWYDVLAAIAALGVAAFVALAYPRLVDMILMPPAAAYISGAILTVVVLETVRRTVGYSLTLIIIVFLLYGLFANFVPGSLNAHPQSWEVLSGYMGYDSSGMLGLPLGVMATIVFAFVLFGNFLASCGGSGFFTDLAMRLMGRFRGGSMKIAVLASTLFGTISGSAVANVMSTGVITIPMNKRAGFPAYKAGAIEAVASTGGQLMPPIMGAAAFLMADFLQVPYKTVAIAALVPALLYYFALFAQADLEAAARGIKGVPESELPTWRNIATGLHFGLSFAVLIYLLFILNWLPERAALVSSILVIAGGFAFGYAGVRPTMKTLLDALVQTGHAMAPLAVICAGAGAVIGVLTVTGVGFSLTDLLVRMADGSKLTLLITTAVICIVLGMGLPTLGVYVLLAALVAPALAALDIPLISAHLYVLYFGLMSMITPPICVAAFAAAGLAKSPPMKTGFAAMKFGWSSYLVPIIFVFSPALLLMDTPMMIVLTIVTVALGIWSASAALAGYFSTKLSVVERVLFFVFGVGSMMPIHGFTNSEIVTLVSALGCVALMARQWFAARRAERLGASPA